MSSPRVYNMEYFDENGFLQYNDMPKNVKIATFLLEKMPKGWEGATNVFEVKAGAIIIEHKKIHINLILGLH